MALNQQFQDACSVVKKLAKRPKDDELLEIYGYYKQATIGDCNTEKPSILSVEASKKWEAWNSKRGMSSDTAKENYVKRANELQSVYGQ